MTARVLIKSWYVGEHRIIATAEIISGKEGLVTMTRGSEKLHARESNCPINICRCVSGNQTEKQAD